MVKNKEILFTDKWNSYLGYFPKENKDIYFFEEYVKLYENGVDKAECFIYKEGDDVLLFPYLKRDIGLPHSGYFDFETPYGYGGPIANTNNSFFINEAFEEFFSLAKRNKMVAGFLRFHPLLNNSKPLAGRKDVVFDRKTVAMKLDLGIDRIWNEQIHAKHRNSIRKAQKLGLNYFIDTELRHMDAFVNMHRSTVKRLRLPEYYYFNDKYFNDMKNLKDNVFLGLVFLKGDIISGALFFKYGIFGHYHLAGSLDNYKQYNPNNFLIYNTALYMKETGMELFHLGGGGDSSMDDNLYKFKKRFSRHEYPFSIGKIIFDEGIYNELCNLWEKRFTGEKERYKKYFLKYRY